MILELFFVRLLVEVYFVKPARLDLRTMDIKLHVDLTGDRTLSHSFIQHGLSFLVLFLSYVHLLLCKKFYSDDKRFWLS